MTLPRSHAQTIYQLLQTTHLPTSGQGAGQSLNQKLLLSLLQEVQAFFLKKINQGSKPNIKLNLSPAHAIFVYKLISIRPIPAHEHWQLLVRQQFINALHPVIIC